MSNQINILLNGEHIKAQAGEYVLNVAKKNGIEIPTLCNDPRLEPFSSCFVCVVEVEGMRGLQPACSTRVFDGMKVHTNNDKVRKSRKAALDLIMSNHYADCVAPCTETCPAGVDVQGYISLIEKGLYKEAVGLIKETNPLPAICGRVCVRPCEAACRRNLMDESSPVGIDYMKRYASDHDLLVAEEHYTPEIAPSTGKKIAIIGAGPGGLSAAYFLQQKGHQCDIFEAAPYAGGWLRYGIPAYRLPNELLDKEIETITELGVNIYCNQKLGDNLNYAKLQKEYDSTILTIGSQKGTLVRAPGENCEGVYSGIDFLRNMEITGKPADFTGKKVVVVGGGNTAMDCCRTAIRCGSTDVKVVYRRTEKEMPANPIEIHESKLEGIEYMLLHNPVQVNSDENNVLKSVTLIQMELGEPDDSGRRRPVAKEGSEFEMECDYILAAVGQKTVVDFLDNVNSVAPKGELKVNKWGDLDTDRYTLQTGIPSMFAAGDGVSGPATIIEAIQQAQVASLSCHQFLMEEEVVPAKKPFVSKKDNFRIQENKEYVENFAHQKREEMPTLEESDRVNFKEVELGYEGEQIVKNEANRCLECGCAEYKDCDLQKFSDEYEVEQKRYGGEYKEYHVDFSHPYIEIDNNKCILCSRCIRVCSDLVGANALGLVNRGFDTYVAPSMGGSLMDTHCESCGLCIDTCPTGAMSENFIFKPGPVDVEAVEAIDNYGGEGVAMNLMAHKGKFVMRVEGAEGLVNPLKTITRRAKFGYKYINDSSRITVPMIREEDTWKEISFEDAYALIAKKIKEDEAEKTVLFAGARLTNEELYLVQKFGREAIGTPHIGNFHYLGRAKGYKDNAIANTPFNQISEASKIILFGAELINDHDYVGYLVNKARTNNEIPVEFISANENTNMLHKTDSGFRIFDYYAFVQAANYYLLSEGKQNQLFLDDRTNGFDAYKEEILGKDFQSLCRHAGVDDEVVKSWADAYNNEMNAILIFSENQISGACSRELYNLAMITGKLGKTANGLMPLKTKNNAQGLFDMGVFPCLKPGAVFDSSVTPGMLLQKVKESAFSNMLIFGEDPVGTATEKEEMKGWIESAKFLVVQDYQMTETAELANLILPASFPIESDGSFTNTQRVLQQFSKGWNSTIEHANFEQLMNMSKRFDVKGFDSVQDVFMEIVTHLPQEENKTYEFTITDKDNDNVYFQHGCDSLMMRIDQEMDLMLS